MCFFFSLFYIFPISHGYSSRRMSTLIAFPNVFHNCLFAAISVILPIDCLLHFCVFLLYRPWSAQGIFAPHSITLVVLYSNMRNALLIVECMAITISILKMNSFDMLLLNNLLQIQRYSNKNEAHNNLSLVCHQHIKRQKRHLQQPCISPSRDSLKLLFLF